MMIQRRRKRSPATPDRRQVRNDLLAQITAGARSFEVGDRDSVSSVQTFQDQVRALESLASDGLITIGARETAPDEPGHILAIRRIRLTEEGKRRLAATNMSSGQAR